MATLKQKLKPLIPAPVWGYLRARATRRHLRKFATRIVEHRYHGQTLKVKIADGLGEGWYDHDWPPQPEIGFLERSKLRAGSTIYDCGAHQLVVAMVMAKIAGPTGRVIAIEANVHNATVGRENVALNRIGLAPIEVVEAAISDTDGTLIFDENLNGQVAGDGYRAGRQEVPAITLNTLSRRFPLPDVIFLDIEGSEAAALKSANELFRDGHRPDWMVEVHANAGLESLGGSVSEVVNFFREHNYTLAYCSQNSDHFLSLTPAITETLSSRFFLVATTGDFMNVSTPAKSH